MATLNDPKTTETLDTVKVVAFKVQDNPSANEFWMEIWSVLGRMDGSQFIEYVDPNTGQVAIYHKIENGRNPLQNSQLLGQCDHTPCSEWALGAISGTCPVCEIGTIQPYDGYTRLYDGKKVKTKDIEDFCCDEQVPHPDTGVVQYLLDATKDA